MATSVGWATLQIIPSADGFSKNLTKETQPGMVAAGKTGGKSFGGGMIAASRSFVAPLAAIFATGSMVNYFRTAVQQAGTIQTAGKVVSRAFGDGAASIKRWAADSNQSFAFTQAEALKMAGTLGFVASQAGGLTGGKLTKFTQQSLQVAQALKVVNGIPVERTMLAIQNAVAGETMALKALGYNISETVIKKKALAMGAKEVDGEISKTARTQALWKLIMEQSKGPLDNLKASQGDLTAQTALARRRWDDLKTTIGQALLPVVNSAFKAFNNFAPVIEKWVSGLIKGGEGAGKFGETLRSGLGSAFQFIQPLIKAFGTVFNTLKNAFIQIWPSIQQAASVIMGVLGPAFTQVRNILANQLIPAFNQFIQAITPFVSWLIETLAPVAAAVFNGLVQIVKGALNIITGVLKVFTGIFTGNWRKVWNGIKQIFRGVWQFLQGFIVTKIGAIGKVIGRGINIMRNVIGKGLNWIRGRWNAVWSWAGNFLRSVWNRIWSAISGFVSRIRSAIGSFLSSVRSRWNSGWRSIGNFLRNAWQKMVTTVRNRIRDVVQFFRNLPGRIKSGLGNLGGLLISAGKDLIRGLLNGIGKMAGQVAQKARDVVGGAVKAAKDALRIGSPSKVFHEIGAWTAEGLANGMTAGSRMVAKSATAMAGIATKNGSPVTSAARPWDSHQGAYGGVSGGVVYNFNARTVDINERTIHPLLKAADARARVGLVR